MDSMQGIPGPTGATGSFSTFVPTTILPTNANIDLGSTGAPFRDLYVSSTSINVGSGVISSDEAGNILFTNAIGDIYSPNNEYNIQFSGSGTSAMYNNRYCLGVSFPKRIYPPPTVTANIISGDPGIVVINSVTTTAAVLDTYTVPSFVNNYAAQGLNWSVTTGSNQSVPYNYTDTLAGDVSFLDPKGFSDGIGQLARFNLQSGIAYDPNASSTVYVADTDNSVIRKIVGAVVTTVAGDVGITDYADEYGTNAKFDRPEGVCVDASGFVYIADTQNNLIRMIYPDGLVTTIAGGDGIDIRSGYIEGRGPAALFNSPIGVTTVSGDVYVADTQNYVIRKVAPNGDTRLVAGQPDTSGNVNGQGTNAILGIITRITSDASGNLYVAEVALGQIRKITPSGQVSTIITGLPTGIEGIFLSVTIDPSGYIYVGALGGIAVYTSEAVPQPDKFISFGDTVPVFVTDMAFDSSGNLFTTLATESGESGLIVFYPGDVSGSLVYIDPSGIPVSSVAIYESTVYLSNPSQILKGDISGNFELFVGDPLGNSDAIDGVGTNAAFNIFFGGLSVDTSGILYVADMSNNRIRKVTPDGTVTTLAGGGFLSNSGFLDSVGPYVNFDRPMDLQIDSGTLYIVDADNGYVRTMDLANGQVSTIMESRYLGLKSPRGSAVDGSGNVYISDKNNSILRKVAPDGTSSRFGSMAFSFDEPANLATDSSGNVWVADYGNDQVCKVTSSGSISIVIENIEPYGIAIDVSGYLYVTDNNNDIYVYTSDGVELPTRTITGCEDPHQIAFDASGTLYIADGMRIRKVRPGTTNAIVFYTAPYSDDFISGLTVTRTNVLYAATMYSILRGDLSGNFEIFAGFPSSESSGYLDGVGTNAKFYGEMSSLSVDASGNLYVVEQYNYAVRKVTPDGTVTTFLIGGNVDRYVDFEFDSGGGIAIDNGMLYVTETYSNRIKSFDLTKRTVTAFAGGGITNDSTSLEGKGILAGFDQPKSCVMDGSGNLYVAEYSVGKIRKVTPDGVTSTFAYRPFETPYALAFDPSGYLWVTDSTINCVFKISPSGSIYMPISGESPSLTDPYGIAIDASGTIYVSDSEGTGNIYVYTSDGVNLPDRTITGCDVPYQITFDASGILYIAEHGSPAGIRIVYPGTTNAIQIYEDANPIYGVAVGDVIYASNTTQILKGTVSGGFSVWVNDISMSPYSAISTRSALGVNSIFLDMSTLYLTDGVSKIRKVAPDGTITTFVGGGFGNSSDENDGVGLQARFDEPHGLAVENGILYVADDSVVRTIDISTGLVTTLAGKFYGSINGIGTNAEFTRPSGIDVKDGVVVVSDTLNCNIRTIG